LSLPTGADDTVRARVLVAYGDATSQYALYRDGKRLEAAARTYSKRTGKLISVQRHTYWQVGQLSRLDEQTLITDPPNDAIGARVSYVVNDYFPFAARALTLQRGFR
jgi:hypothetical protein